MRVQQIYKPDPGVKLTRPDKHNVLIVDLSGSMDWATDALAKDTIKRVQDLPDGDFLSLAYFSGEGDYRWLVKGVKTDAKGKQSIEAVIKNNFRARNTTCFSEVLGTTAQVIADVAPFSNVISLVFMSDGHPVVSSLERETTAIFKAIAGIKGQISDAVVVGYGDYYNRELLTKMAQALGATFTHAQSVEAVGEEFVKASKKKTARKLKIKVPKNAQVVFTVQDGEVAVQTGDEISETAQAYSITAGDKNGLDDSLAYAGALALMQADASDRALELMGSVGDVGIVNAIANAITNEEMGAVEERIKLAFANPGERFKEGRTPDCVPKADVFDVLDCLELLGEDESARFYPFHPSFSYKKIGRKTKVKEGYPTFEPYKGIGASFTSLVWNQKRLNLSVSMSISGHVQLKDGYEALGLPQNFPISVFRTYSMVANGLPNVRVLPASVSEATWQKLVAEGVIQPNGGWKEGKIFMLQLFKLPVCNRAKAKTVKLAKEVAQDAISALVLGGQIKAWKAIQKELDPEKEFGQALTSYSPAQVAFLAENGIVNGKHQPPMETEEATDVLPVREFEITISKYSNLPSLAEVRKQQAKGKFTDAGRLVYAGLQDYEVQGFKQKGEALAWLALRIKAASAAQRALTRQIQQAKFATVLGKQWFRDLSRSAANVEVELAGHKYQVGFDLRTVDEKI